MVIYLSGKRQLPGIHGLKAKDIQLRQDKNFGLQSLAMDARKENKHRTI